MTIDRGIVVSLEASSKDCLVDRSHFAKYDMTSYRSWKTVLVLILAGPRYVWAKSGQLLPWDHWFRKKLEMT